VAIPCAVLVIAVTQMVLHSFESHYVIVGLALIALSGWYWRYIRRRLRNLPASFIKLIVAPSDDSDYQRESDFAVLCFGVVMVVLSLALPLFG
jgi:predicted permease